MRLQWVPANENYTTRFESETGMWEVGLRPKTFGRFGVAFSRGGGDAVVQDYCCGNDLNLIAEVLVNVITILSTYPEDVSEAELQRDFPQWKTRPIHNDPCRQKLKEKANAIVTAWSPWLSESEAS